MHVAMFLTSMCYLYCEKEQYDSKYLLQHYQLLVPLIHVAFEVGKQTTLGWHHWTHWTRVPSLPSAEPKHC